MSEPLNYEDDDYYDTGYEDDDRWATWEVVDISDEVAKVNDSADS